MTMSCQTRVPRSSSSRTARVMCVNTVNGWTRGPVHITIARAKLKEQASSPPPQNLGFDRSSNLFSSLEVYTYFQQGASLSPCSLKLNSGHSCRQKLAIRIATLLRLGGIAHTVPTHRNGSYRVNSIIRPYTSRWSENSIRQWKVLRRNPS
jgi:hypothetical protein